MGIGVSPSGLAGAIAPESELESLQAQAKTMEEQIKATKERIAGFQTGVSILPFLAVVDHGTCTACSVCVQACPVDAINVNKFAQVNGAKCTGCGCCVAECPQSAISLHKR